MVETFYADRWYNVFEVFEGGSKTRKGWYCNLTRPARLEADHIYSEDLALDVLVAPDGTSQIRDEAEFVLLDLKEAEQREVLRAAEDLRIRAARRAAPFGRPNRPRGRQPHDDGETS